MTPLEQAETEFAPERERGFGVARREDDAGGLGASDGEAQHVGRSAAALERRIPLHLQKIGRQPRAVDQRQGVVRPSRQMLKPIAFSRAHAAR